MRNQYRVIYKRRGEGWVVAEFNSRSVYLNCKKALYREAKVLGYRVVVEIRVVNEYESKLNEKTH